MKDLKDGGAGAIDEWAKTIEQRLSAGESLKEAMTPPPPPESASIQLARAVRGKLET